MLTDQQLIVHAFAPADGPHASDAYDQLRAVWSRCRDLLGLTVPIAGLPSVLPADLAETAGRPVVVALEDSTAARQAIVRRIDKVVNLSVAFTAAQETSQRRRLIGSASPPGWVEFDRWWDELAGDGLEALLGVARLYVAQQVGKGTRGDVAQAVRSVLPRDEELPFWWDRGELRLGEFALWELTPDDHPRAERRIAIVAPAGRDAQCSVWTWSNGQPDIPPLARYLMHAAKARYEARVWDGGRAVGHLRRRVDLAVDQLQRAVGGPHVSAAAHRLMAEEMNLATALHDVQDMRRAIDTMSDNMTNALDPPLPADLSITRWLRDALEDAVADLTTAARTAAQISEIAQRHGRAPAPAAEPRAARAPSRAEVRVRVGFGVDVVGYSARPAPAKDEVQRRVAAMLQEVLADLRIGVEETDRQDAGDATKVFLPPEVELHRAVPALLSGWREQLRRDNERHTDPIRLRLAVGVGPVGLAALGFGGNTIVEVSRLLDCDALRAAMRDHPQTDLAALVSHQLYEWTIGEGYGGLDAARFRQVSVAAKDFAATAWLWVAD